MTATPLKDAAPNAPGNDAGRFGPGAFERSAVRALYDTPLFELLDRARVIHRAHHPEQRVELCTLLSVKTGGCPEDCAYCPQSSHYATDVSSEKMLDVADVLAAARRAKENGSTRFCMGAAWREVKDGPAFERVLRMVRGVKDIGLEACVTLGMLTEPQAVRLKDAGLDAYNHNLDTSREHYRSIISTRTFDDRLRTLETVRKAGITVCSGGIIGLGESDDDRCEMLRTLANLETAARKRSHQHLGSGPGNAARAFAAGESLGPRKDGRVRSHPPCPRARVRLSAGRTELTREAQVLALYAGAKFPIFYGDKLLVRLRTLLRTKTGRCCGMRDFDPPLRERVGLPKTSKPTPYMTHAVLVCRTVP